MCISCYNNFKPDAVSDCSANLFCGTCAIQKKCDECDKSFYLRYTPDKTTCDKCIAKSNGKEICCQCRVQVAIGSLKYSTCDACTVIEEEEERDADMRCSECYGYGLLENGLCAKCIRDRCTYCSGLFAPAALRRCSGKLICSGCSIKSTCGKCDKSFYVKRKSLKKTCDECLAKEKEDDMNYRDCWDCGSYFKTIDADQYYCDLCDAKYDVDDKDVVEIKRRSNKISDAEVSKAKKSKK
jgi:hypothetical protein